MNDNSVKRLDGIVEEALPGTNFRVKSGDKMILAHLSGKMRMNYIKILPGDKVTLEVSTYDETRGRIIRRL
ncbi:MAG: translation initiation factor IF-1 [Patescibacteria group bacterium]|nr:translation initiation factor IF-1 [Patescibacteria group bacterium]